MADMRKIVASSTQKPLDFQIRAFALLNSFDRGSSGIPCAFSS
jgi:hypothetical protein